MVPEEQIYSTIGDAGFARLIGAFYRRVKADDLLAPLYPPQDFEAAEERLRGFVIQRFGGPASYSERRGHPRLRMRHAPFAIDAVAARRWITLMNEALAEAALPGEVEETLRNYFEQTAAAMINRAS